MTKLEILKKYLKTVEESQYYWSDVRACNCGLLLKSIGYESSEINELADLLQIREDNDVIDNFVEEIEQETLDEYDVELDGIYYYLFSLWKIEEPELQCEITKLPFQEVVDKLLSYGFTIDELKDLEHLSNKRINDTYLIYKNKEHLIKYIENWIKLEENK